jgi:hypothetical protein
MVLGKNYQFIITKIDRMLATLRALLNTVTVLLVSYIYPDSDATLKMGISMFIVEFIEILIDKRYIVFPGVFVKIWPKMNTVNICPC